jgi:hypothetical protein
MGRADLRVQASAADSLFPNGGERWAFRTLREPRFPGRTLSLSVLCPEVVDERVANGGSNQTVFEPPSVRHGLDAAGGVSHETS